MSGKHDIQIIQAPATVKISTKEFAAKYKSKREVFNFLSVDMGVYVPPYEQVSIYHLKDLLTSKKKRKCDQVRLVPSRICFLFHPTSPLTSPSP